MMPAIHLKEYTGRFSNTEHTCVKLCVSYKDFIRPKKDEMGPRISITRISEALDEEQ